MMRPCMFAGFVFWLVTGRCQAVNHLYCTQQLNECQCITNQPGFILDLRRFDSGSSTKASFSAKAPDGYTYMYSPCTPFSLDVSGSCGQPTAVCQWSSDDNNYQAGYHVNAQFQFDMSAGLYVRYYVIDSQGHVARTTKVFLQCHAGEDGLQAMGELPLNSGNYYLQLNSTYFCRK